MAGPNLYRTRKFAAMFVMAAGFILLYQNCDPAHEGETTTGSLGTAEMRRGFAEAFYPLTSVNCKACHVTGGAVSQKPFADPDINLAFSGFMIVTGGKNTEIYRTKGLDSHGGLPTANTPENLAALDAAIQKYSELAFPPVVPYQYLSAQINAPTAAPVTTDCANVAAAAAPTISINLAQLPQGPATPVEGTFTISVTKHNRGTPASHIYCFSRPRIVAGTKALNVTGIYFRLNGKYLSTTTTYNLVNANAVAGQTLDVSLTPAIYQLTSGDFSASDKIEIGFGSISN